MQMQENLTSERLILMRPESENLELAQEIFAAVELSRATLRPWLPWVDKTLCAQDELTFYLNSYCRDNWNNRSGFPYLIRTKSAQEFIGCIDLMNIDNTNSSAEIGYWLADSASRHGYCQEALHLLESAGFAQGLNRIIIRNDPQNLRSVNVAKRCGYHLDGVMRQDKWSDYFNTFVDSNIFSKLKSEASYL